MQLRQVKNTADHWQQQIDQPSHTMNIQPCYSAAAAAAYNDQFQPKKSKRRIFLHELHYDHDFLRRITFMTLTAQSVTFRPIQPFYGPKLLPNHMDLR
jgi:hypothetical protein